MNIAFITYLNRSGSTFLLNQLSKVNMICVCPEAEVLIEILLADHLKTFKNPFEIEKIFETKIKNDRKFRTWNLSKYDINFQGLKNYADLFFSILNAFKNKYYSDSELVIFKATDLIHFYNVLPETYSENYHIKWISLIRDPRAVYYSQKKTISPPFFKPMANNPLNVADHWNCFVTDSLSYQNNYDFYIVNYEVLIRSFNSDFSKLMKWLMPENSKSSLSDKGKVTEFLTDEYKVIFSNIDDPPDKNRILYWKDYLKDHEIYLIEKVCKKIILAMYYPLRFPEVKLPGLYIIMIYFRIKRKSLQLKKWMKRKVKKIIFYS